MPEPPTHSKLSTGEGNRESILDAAERLARRGNALNFSALSAEAGLSRPTIYSHFADRKELAQALLTRATDDALAAMSRAAPDEGPAPVALDRVVRTSWEQLARHQDLGRVVMAEMGPEEVHAAHQEIMGILIGLLTRGRRQGTIRTDLSVEWLALSCVALIHAAVAATQRGGTGSARSLKALLTTVEDLCTVSRQGSRRPG